jgi:hypothetical protein
MGMNMEKVVEDTTFNLLKLAVVELPADVEEALKRAYREETSEAAAWGSEELGLRGAFHYAENPENIRKPSVALSRRGGADKIMHTDLEDLR